MKKFSVESGYLLKNGVSLYLKELIMRLHWFTQLRWLWIVVCLVGSIATMFSLIPAKVNSHYLIGSAVFLAITNIIYTLWTKLVISDVIDIKKIRVVIISQVHTDYMVLALVTYAFGGIETPVLALFLAEIGLVSLFCNRYVSFSLTLTGAIFATLPILLEYLGIIPILSIYMVLINRLLLQIRNL